MPNCCLVSLRLVLKPTQCSIVTVAREQGSRTRESENTISTVSRLLAACGEVALLSTN